MIQGFFESFSWATSFRGRMATNRERTPPRDKARLQADRAEALRMTGQFDAAVEGFSAALEFDGKYAVAFLGMGRSVADRAIAGFSPEDPESGPRVLAEFDQAEELVQSSLNPELWGMESDHNIAVGRMQLAELELMRAALSPDGSDAHIANAQSLFEQARAGGETSALFAELGLARVEVMRGRLVPGTRIVGDDASEVLRAQLVADIATNLQRESHYRNARNRLLELLENNEAFAAGKTELARIFLLFNEKGDARRSVRSAIRHNPNDLSAYGVLLEVLDDDGDRREERRMVRSAYENTVTPQRRQVTAAVSQIQQTARVEPEQVDMLALVASPSRVTLESYRNLNSASVTLKNTGNQAVTVDDVRIVRDSATAFALDKRQCDGRTLEPADECNVTISIGQAGGGEHDAVLVIESSSGVDTRVPLKAYVHVEG